MSIDYIAIYRTTAFLASPQEPITTLVIADDHAILDIGSQHLSISELTIQEGGNHFSSHTLHLQIFGTFVDSAVLKKQLMLPFQEYSLERKESLMLTICSTPRDVAVRTSETY